MNASRAAFTLLALVATLATAAAADPLFPDAPGRAAPGGAVIGKPLNLKFTGVMGKHVDLADYKGKVVLIDFWATWCGPCVEEVPKIVAAYEKYHDRGFAVLGISADTDRAALLKFTQEHKMRWPQYFDGGDLSANAIAKRFGVAEIPCLWLVDKEGKLATFHGGADLQKKIEALLAR